MPRLSNKRLEAALAGQERAIREAFLEAIRTNKIDLNALAEAIERGDIQRAVQIAQLTPAQLYALDAAITGAYVAGGNTIVQAAPSYAVSFGFDGRADRAQRWALENAAGRVTEIVNDQREMLQTAIGEQVINGVNPRKAAVNIAGKVNPATGFREGGLVGLTSGQAQTVSNVRTDLANLDSRYFTRSLRDRRYDGLVSRAIRDGKPLSQADIDRIAARYADKALKHRADTIARTESINALRAGRDEGVRQAMEQGAVSEAQKEWSATDPVKGRRTRDAHVDMDGQKVAMDEPFVSPDGYRLMYPGDSDLGAPASLTVSCRCWTSYEIDWLLIRHNRWSLDGIDEGDLTNG